MRCGKSLLPLILVTVGLIPCLLSSVYPVLFPPLFSRVLAAEQALDWRPYEIKGNNGRSMNGEVAYISVPENRDAIGRRQLRLGFVRLKSTSAKPGNPIVYLAGGPGGSATGAAAGPRMSLFETLREVADVIVFDQRGTGLSRNGLENCRYQPDIPLGTALTREDYLRNVTLAGEYCAEQWRAAGIDLNGYNTRENARDLEALRIALNTEKMDLWAISYGTHLAFAMAKYFPDSVGRMVLASSEGPDHTIKLPSRSDAQINRIAGEIRGNAEASAKYPDLPALMRRVIQKYSDNPVVVDATDPATGEQVKVGVGDLEIMGLTVGGLTRDPGDIARLPAFYSMLDAGMVAPLGNFFLALRISLWELNPMSVGMDAASGISPRRWEQVEREAADSLLWRTHNLPFPDINGALGIADLGDEFRQAPASEIPTLFLAGTLDGRTFIETQKELAAGFSNGVFVSVKRGGHNLFLSSPTVIETMLAFYRGAPLTDFTIELPAIAFQ